MSEEIKESAIVPPDEWRFVSGISYMSVARTGWKGIYDILKSMILRRSLFRVMEPVTISCWVKSNVECCYKVDHVTMEWKNK